MRSGDKVAFADIVRKGYPDLFATYTDAHKQDATTLQTFFRTHTSVGEKAQSFCVRTFLVLVEFGDFGTPTKTKAGVEKAAAKHEEKLDLSGAGGGGSDDDSDGGRRSRSGTPQLALTVNLQIELPPSADGEVYDKLFAAMGKHLKGLITTVE